MKKKKGGDDPKKSTQGALKEVVVKGYSPKTMHADSLALYNANEKYNEEARHILETSKTDREYATRMGYTLGAGPNAQTGILKETSDIINKILVKHPDWEPITNTDPGVKLMPGGIRRHMENVLGFKKPVELAAGGSGKVRPILVHDPNDPRYRAYQDSLGLYNKTLKYLASAKGAQMVGPREMTLEEADIAGNPGSGWNTIGSDGKMIKTSVAYDSLNKIYPQTMIGYKKPVQPVILQRRPIPNIPPVPLADTTLAAPAVTPNFNITPTPPLPQTGVLKQDFKGVPGIRVVSKKVNGTLIPVALENSAGESIDYNKYANGKFPEGFQYPKKYEKGGVAMKKKKGPRKMELGGTSIDPSAYLAMSEADQHAYFTSLPDDQKQAFVQAVQSYQDQRGQITNPLTPQRAGIPTNIPAKRNVLPATTPLPAAGTPRRNIGAEIATIQPSDTTQKPNTDAYNKGLINDGLDTLATVGTVASGFIDQANMANPAQTEIAPSAIAGGVSGLLQGGPLGALIGGIGGALKAGSQRTAYEEQQVLKRRNLLSGLRIAPSIQETGGVVADEDVDVEGAPEEQDIDIPVQEEKGELMLFPDGRLVDSMATKTHKQMDKDDVTDFLPSGTMVLSNSKKRLINLAKIKDDVFTITKGHYSEDGNEPGETILMGDVYGKKGKKTPAELAKKVREDFPVIENPVEQIEINTNKENLRRRAELLLPIMQLQEKAYKKFEFDKPVKYEKGGMVMGKKKCIPKLAQGTGPCGIGFIQDQYGNCIPDTAQVTAMAPDPMQATGAGAVSSATPPITFKRPASLPDSVLNSADPILANQNDQIDSNYASSVTDTQNLYRSQRLRNIGILAARLGGIGFQNPEVTPVTQEAGDVNAMFPKITESQINAQVDPVRESQNRVLSSINDSGISGSRLGSAIASTQARLIDNESQVRSHANDVNQSQMAKRYERLNSIANLNSAAAVGAENDTRSNRNQLVSNIGDVVAGNIRDQGGLKESLAGRLEELKKWRDQNKATVTEAEYNNMVRKEERRFKQEDNLRLLDIVKKYMTG